MPRALRIEYPGAIYHVMNRGDQLGWTGAELARRAKGDVRKIRIAQRLRAETAVTLKWIASQLHMGTWTHVANRLQNAKGKHEPKDQTEFSLV